MENDAVNELKCIKSECGNQTVKIEIKGKLLKQAKAMEKEQMRNASCPYIGGWEDNEFEYYYNKTFKKTDK